MFYAPLTKPEDWQQFLADPEKHWRDEFSAKSLAFAWQNAQGFPLKVKSVFDKSVIKQVHSIELLMGFPEYKVPLPGGARASQNDIFLLCRNEDGLLSIMVEGKVEESFGPLVEEWLNERHFSTHERFEYLTEILNLKNKDVNKIRYQLLHRTASAIIEAKRFCSRQAMVLVHSFSKSNTSFSDYEKYLSIYGVKGKIDSVTEPINFSDVNVYFAWVNDDFPKYR